MSRTLRSFRSTATGRARVISTELGASRSYPVARIFSEYEPDPSFDEGKAKRPRSSLTTLTVTVEPAFFALTTTPSIAHSSAELTRPVRAVEVWASAGLTPPPARNATDIRPALTTSKRRLVMDDSLVDPLRLARYFSPIRFRVTAFNFPEPQTMIDLYAAGTSNGMRARIGLEECGLAYNFHPLDLGKGEQKSPSFLAMNPNGQIPVIVDSDGPGGKPVTVSQSVAVLLLRREIGQVPAEGSRGPARVLAGARERGERHERDGHRDLHAIPHQGPARAGDRRFQVDVEELHEGLGRQARQAALRRRRRSDCRRLRALRGGRACQGRAARPGGRICERRALGRRHGRAPGRAEGDEVLNQPTTRAACSLCPSVIPRSFIQS